MTRTRLTVVAALGIAAVAAAGCGGGGEVATTPPQTTTTTTTTTATTTKGGGSTLDGTDGPGFTITLTRGGQPVTALAPGRYTLVVSDQSNAHNFHLSGPGVDVTTDVAFTGTKTFHVTLQDGTYTFVCDPHASSMHGSFTVSG